MTIRTLDPQAHARIAATIREAETRTSGEIYCVVARSSDSYFHAAACFLSAALLIASFAVAFALEYLWIGIRLPIFVAAQILAFAAALALLWAMPRLRIRLVPRRLRYRRAHDNAMKQFLARNVHITTARTGVLIFVSLAEQYAEILADSGINSRVPQATWNTIVGDLVDHARSDRLADGYVAAVLAVGNILQEHFPVSAGDNNELDDHLVEI
jgi:putative membrane protein